MKRPHSILSLFLAASLLMSGWVGLSPVLHHWLEHGGKGELHTHRHAHPHGHAAEQERGDTFGLPTAAFETLLRAAGHGALAVLPDQSSDSPTDASNHHHFTLPQLLSGGGVDVTPEFLPPAPAQRTALTATVADHGVLSERWFDAQSAGRAPPSFRG